MARANLIFLAAWLAGVAKALVATTLSSKDGIQYYVPHVEVVSLTARSHISFVLMIFSGKP